VNGFLVAESDDSQHPALKFRNHTPESVPVMLLRLNFQRILDNTDTPFLYQVRPFSQNFFFKIFSKLIIGTILLHYILFWTINEYILDILVERQFYFEACLAEFLNESSFIFLIATRPIKFMGTTSMVSTGHFGFGAKVSNKKRFGFSH